MSVDAEIDLDKIQKRKQLKIQQSNIRENAKRNFKSYSKGDMITLGQPGAILCTLMLPRQGPYKVVKHHENSSIKFKLELNVIDRVNICRCYHYCLLPKDENNPNANTQPSALV